MTATASDRPSTAGPPTHSAPSGVLLTALAVIAVHAVSAWIVRIPQPVPIFLLAVTYAAFSGGLLQGMISALLVVSYTALTQSVPGVLFVYTPDGSTAVLIATATAPTIAILVGALRHRERERMRELHATSERLRELDDMRAEFLSTISHELRLPLTAIRWTAESLLSAEERGLAEPTLRRDSVERIAAGAEELGLLIDDLLDFSRIEHGLVRLSPRTVSIREEIDHVLQRMHGVLAEHRVHVWAPLELEAIVDTNAFFRVVSNVLSNAAKFSPPGTSVTVTARRDGEAIAVSIIDQGPGIPAEHLEHIFERYYRGGHASAAKGMGIGLDVAARFAQAMGGSLNVTSEDGHGAEFTLRVPACRQPSTTIPQNRVVEAPTGPGARPDQPITT